MKKAEEKLASIGFIFGYKDSQKITNENGTSIKISTFHGISDKFPNKYKNKKDFYAQEIKEGDKSELFINPQHIAEGFKQEWFEVNNSHDYYKERFEEERYLMTFPIDLETFKILSAINISALYAGAYQRWESEEIKEKSINDILSETNISKEALKKYTPYQMYTLFIEVQKYLYEKSLEDFAKDFSMTTTPVNSQEDSNVSKPEESLAVKKKMTK